MFIPGREAASSVSLCCCPLPCRKGDGQQPKSLHTTLGRQPGIPAWEQWFVSHLQCGRAQVTVQVVPRGAGWSPVMVLWALESLSPCLSQKTCRSRGSRAFTTMFSWWPEQMLHSSAASHRTCCPSAPLFSLPSRNPAQCVALPPLSLSSGKMDRVISEPGHAAVI